MINKFLSSTKSIFLAQPNLRAFLHHLSIARPFWPPFPPLTSNLNLHCLPQGGTIPHHCTLLAISNRSTILLNFTTSASSHFYLSLTCIPHVALTSDLSVHCKFPGHFLSTTILLFHTKLLALHIPCKQSLSA